MVKSLCVWAAFFCVPATAAGTHNFCDDRGWKHGAQISCHFSGAFHREIPIKPGAPFYLISPSPGLSWVDDDGLHVMVNPCEVICKSK